MGKSDSNKNFAPPPKMLYRYRPPHRNTLRSLRDDRVWFSRADSLNDPFEFSNKIKPSITPSEWKAYCQGEVNDGKIDKSLLEKAILYGLDSSTGNVGEHILRQNSENADTLYKRALKHGVCCFSEHPNNILMWSHYAKNHQGICLGFDTSISNFNLSKKVQSTDTSFK